MMLTNIPPDIYRAANEFIRRYGKDADIFLKLRLSRLFEMFRSFYVARHNTIGTITRLAMFAVLHLSI